MLDVLGMQMLIIPVKSILLLGCNDTVVRGWKLMHSTFKQRKISIYRAWAIWLCNIDILINYVWISQFSEILCGYFLFLKKNILEAATIWYWFFKIVEFLVFPLGFVIFLYIKYKQHLTFFFFFYIHLIF